MIVNLNCECKVQLNNIGKTIWYSQIDAIPEEVLKQHPEVVPAIKQRVDIDGNLTATLWEVMAIFGPHISMVQTPFTKSTIELNKNPNFGNYFPVQETPVETSNNNDPVTENPTDPQS